MPPPVIGFNAKLFPLVTESSQPKKIYFAVTHDTNMQILC